MNKKYRRLPIIAIGFIILIAYPILSAVNKDKMVMGIPILFVYIFIVWMLVIVLTFFSFHKKN